MCKELRGPNVRTPPKADNWGVVERWLLGKERAPIVLGELTAVGHSTIELFGVAILMTADSNTEVFGRAEGTQADVDKDIRALTKRYQETCALLGTAWTAEDVDAGQYENGRTSPALFKNTDVPVAPANTAGERLVAYHLNRT
jgi:hypothetical protein